MNLPRPPVVCLVVGPGDCAGRPLTEVVAAAVAGGVNLVQLRDKTADDDTLLGHARALSPLLREAGVPLIVNDRIEVAAAAGAAGVHLGQEDGDPAAARARLGPNALIGRSVKTPAQARSAAAEPVDYLGVGAVYPSATKPASAIIGLDGLARICALSACPVLAIGGITTANAAPLRAAGAAGAAVVSAIAAAPDPRAAARALSTALETQ